MFRDSMPAARSVRLPASLFVLFCLAAIPALAAGPQAATRRPAKMSFLDNGVVRLGVDLNLGGAVTYLSRSDTEQNLVNSFDCGRQIRMFLYSGPVPFAVAGKQPKPEWRFIGWNPIQVGDAFGNAAKVLETAMTPSSFT